MVLRGDTEFSKMWQVVFEDFGLLVEGQHSVIEASLHMVSYAVVFV